MKCLYKKWARFAKQDIKDAEILFNQDSFRSASWHCHQATEKILKAIIIKNQKKPKRIHDLVQLVQDAKVRLPEGLMEFVEELDLYYLPPRYPDVYEQMKDVYNTSNIKNVLEMTKKLFLWLNNHLQ